MRGCLSGGMYVTASGDPDVGATSINVTHRLLEMLSACPGGLLVWWTGLQCYTECWTNDAILEGSGRF